MRKHLLIVLLILVFAALPAFSAEYYYEKGDTAFTFGVGVDFPVFQGFVNNDTKGFETGIKGTHTYIGGYGTLSYESFVTRNLAVGGEIGYAFNNSFAMKILTTIPITAKLSYYPVQTGKFDLILHANAGITVLRYDNNRFLAPHIKLSVNPVYYITDSWGIGIDAGLWANYEFYGSSASGSKSTESAFGVFAPLTLSLIYRH